MITLLLHTIVRKEWILISIIIGALHAQVFAQQNCVISPISGPTNVSSNGVYTFYVTSVAAASTVWTVPPGATLISSGTGRQDSAVVQFDLSFTDGIISARRNSIKCLNLESTLYVTNSGANCNLNIYATEVQSISCAGDKAMVSVTAAGGAGPYNGVGTFSIPAGSHVFTVTDANGCTAQASIIIAEPSQLNASSSASAILCYGGSSVVDISATGGTTPYLGIGSYTELAGTYNYIVTDANGCTAQTSINVTEPSLLVASANASPILCYGGTSVVDLSAVGGTTPYSGTGNYTEFAGSYNYVVTDANGCMAQTSVSITQPDELVVAAIPDQTVYYGYAPMACATLNVNASGGTTPYAYNWSTGQQDVSITVCPNADTDYNVLVVDNNGCSTSAIAKVYAVDVVCYAGNSSVAKVSICHIPPGNPNNPQQLCISANAVADHLAHGCKLGDCSGRFQESDPVGSDIQLNIYPNPATVPTVNVELISTSAEICDLRVYDMQGRVVMELKELLLDPSESRKISFNIEEYERGYYFIKAVTTSCKMAADVLVK